ncbi:MAG TPA: hypothetical protein VL742_14835 [Casimicrobiaceae bacterium]|nr:hypothetical protein [Casimicrobiaceae bacterium]
MEHSLEQPLDIAAGNAANKVRNATQAAHETTDRVARAATVQVDRLRGTAHDAVDGAASLLESASASIRSRPVAVAAGVLIVGFLLGRLTAR